MASAFQDIWLLRQQGSPKWQRRVQREQRIFRNDAIDNLPWRTEWIR